MRHLCNKKITVCSPYTTASSSEAPKIVHIVFEGYTCQTLLTAYSYIHAVSHGTIIPLERDAVSRSTSPMHIHHGISIPTCFLIKYSPYQTLTLSLNSFLDAVYVSVGLIQCISRSTPALRFLPFGKWKMLYDTDLCNCSSLLRLYVDILGDIFIVAWYKLKNEKYSGIYCMFFFRFGGLRALAFLHTKKRHHTCSLALQY